MHSTRQTSKACNNIWVSNYVIVLRIDILSKLRCDYLNMRGKDKLLTDPYYSQVDLYHPLSIYQIVGK